MTVFLVEELLEEGYEYVMMGRFQSDPLERRFSQYRQMSGGGEDRFIVLIFFTFRAKNFFVPVDSVFSSKFVFLFPFFLQISEFKKALKMCRIQNF